MAEAKIIVSGVGEILKNLISMATEEIGLIWNVKEELNKLVRTVNAIQALIHDAEKQQEEKETVRLFLRRLKDVAYAAEDVLDEFGYQTTRLQVTNSKGLILSPRSASARSIRGSSQNSRSKIVAKQQASSIHWPSSTVGSLDCV